MLIEAFTCRGFTQGTVHAHNTLSCWAFPARSARSTATIITCQTQLVVYGPAALTLQALALISIAVFMLVVNVQVALCFHSSDHVTLPNWVLDIGQQNPDIYFTDRAGNRNLECLTFGIDAGACCVLHFGLASTGKMLLCMLPHMCAVGPDDAQGTCSKVRLQEPLGCSCTGTVSPMLLWAWQAPADIPHGRQPRPCMPGPAVPVLAGRSAIAAYQQFIQSFREEFKEWLGSTITDVVVGLGPAGELRYPSQPRDRRWNFPGIGEFQVSERIRMQERGAGRGFVSCSSLSAYVLVSRLLCVCVCGGARRWLTGLRGACAIDPHLPPRCSATTSTCSPPSRLRRSSSTSPAGAWAGRTTLATTACGRTRRASSTSMATGLHPTARSSCRSVQGASNAPIHACQGLMVRMACGWPRTLSHCLGAHVM